jgi:hypothetical protein
MFYEKNNMFYDYVCYKISQKIFWNILQNIPVDILRYFTKRPIKIFYKIFQKIFWDILQNIPKDILRYFTKYPKKIFRYFG